VSLSGMAANMTSTKTPKTGKTEPVPRHNEINEKLAKKIVKSLTQEQ
jgi:hypothetical protein